MLEEIITQLQAIIMDYGAFGLFLGGLIKEFIPIPSTAIIVASSFLLLKDQIIGVNSILSLLFIIAIPITLGMTISSFITYIPCFYIGKPFIDRWGKFLSLKWEYIKKTEKKFETNQHDYLILFILRTTPIIPSVVISAFCGIIRYDLRKYLIITFLGGLTRAIIFGLIGWQFGNLYNISNQMSFLGEIVTLI
ncbi:MAG: VTT domain-containing protein [Methanobacteriaceae archaeon]|jgi:membrane protein DedA with SNARE-associated domain|nr:VTT domain-containing protein [Candidatus Methanorudis spinitermitis]